MNDARRKRLNEAVARLNAGKLILEDVASDERMAFDDLPENLQDGEQGEKMSDCADGLETAVSDLDTLISEIETLGE